jgi:hypothetical protein
MMTRSPLLRITFFTLLALLPAAGSRAAEPPSTEGAVVLEGLIPQIASGGDAFYMEFSFLNSTAAPATVTLSFFDSAALPMMVTYMQDGVEVTSTTLAETVAPRGVEFVQTTLNTESVSIGYARVLSSPVDAVRVLTDFNQVVPGRPLFKTFIPEVRSASGVLFVPARNMGGLTASLAVVSLANQDVTFIARNINGVEQCRYGQPLSSGEHTAFIVPDLLACIAGMNAVVEVQGSLGLGLYAVGITAQDDGAFSTQPAVAGPPLLIF